MNLTEHPVILDAVPRAEADSSPTQGDGDDTGQPPALSPALAIPRDTGLARVAESRIVVASLETQVGQVREVRLRRSDTVVGLPPPREGVLYLVPRLTAAAARHRGDLVFPHEQYRDATGQVAGAASLGRFEPEPARRERHGWGPSWTDVPTLTRWFGGAIAVATALLGGALGVLPDVIAGDPAQPDFRPRLVTGVGLLVAGTLAIWASARLWRHREDVLRRRGTAYVIDELAEAWTYEEKRSFVADLATHFASVLHVPGPAELGDQWRWPLGAGAERWAEKVEDLVRAFWAVHYNDDQETHNAVLVWAWWPVALAFAARATAGRRRVTLRVRQRPSQGREGGLEGLGWRQEPHMFTRDPGLQARGRALPERTVTLTVTPRAQSPADPAQPRPAEPAEPAEPGESAARRDPAEPTVLLVRLTHGVWGDELRPATPADAEIVLTVDDAAGIGFTGTRQVKLLEWQCLAPTGTHHPWADYPALAQSATDWIARTARGLAGPVLVGMLVPQEVGLGIGVMAGATPREHWPEHLWPVQAQRVDGRQQLVIPGIDLGSRWIHANETSRGR